MFDTTKLTLLRHMSKSIETDKCIQKLSNRIELIKNSQHIMTVGKLSNLNVSVSDSRIKIEGSLCKYYYGGENQSSLTRTSTKEAIQKLEDELSLPVSKGVVHRIDTGVNIITEYIPDAYYGHLGQSKHYDRLEQNNGIYYRNHCKSIVFYDKIKEQNLTKTPILPAYQNSNLLRYEFRLLNRLRYTLKVSEINVFHLYDEDFYRNMLFLFRDEFLKIPKSKIPHLDPNNCKNVIDLMNMLISLGIETLGGYTALQRIITQTDKMNFFDNKMQKKRLLDKIDAINNSSYMIESPLMTELETKIIDSIHANLKS